MATMPEHWKTKKDISYEYTPWGTGYDDYESPYHMVKQVKAHKHTLRVVTIASTELGTGLTRGMRTMMERKPREIEVPCKECDSVRVTFDIHDSGVFFTVVDFISYGGEGFLPSDFRRLLNNVKYHLSTSDEATSALFIEDKFQIKPFPTNTYVVSIDSSDPHTITDEQPTD